MIWGGPGGKLEKEIFFPRDCLRENFFSRRRTILSYRRAIKKNFSLEKRHQKFFFLDFLRARPQIINGRSLTCIWFKHHRVQAHFTFSYMNKESGLNLTPSHQFIVFTVARFLSSGHNSCATHVQLELKTWVRLWPYYTLPKRKCNFSEVAFLLGKSVLNLILDQKSFVEGSW